jgi:heat shock protein HslJ
MLVLAGALAACGDSGAGGSVTDPAGGGVLEGRWALTGYALDGRMAAPPSGVTADAVFEGGRLSGRAPVNAYSGPFTAGEDGTLRIGPVARTQMAGPPAANRTEDAYFRALEATAGYAAEGGTLTLRDASGAAVLTFDEAPVSITGDWEVTGYNNGRQAVVSVLAGSAVTARFAADGALTGDTGVNAYTTTYETTPDGAASLGIRIAPPATTRRAGPDALMAQERQYLAALESARTVAFEGEGATLRDGTDAIAVTLTRR